MVYSGHSGENAPRKSSGRETHEPHGYLRTFLETLRPHRVDRRLPGLSPDAPDAEPYLKKTSQQVIYAERPEETPGAFLC